jgi:hypothetical protein
MILDLARLSSKLRSRFDLRFLASSGQPLSYWNLNPCLKRLCVYFLIFNIRGWVLYLGLNEVEERLLGSSLSPSPCWYDELLPVGSGACSGRGFDFSDHVVLYFVQIIIAPTFELFWTWSESESARASRSSWAPRVVTSCFVAYLCLITLLEAWKTVSFFHTPLESFVGYFISMLIQVPLIISQCNQSHRSAIRSLLE